MSDRPDVHESAVTPRNASDERPTILDDTFGDERTIPLSVAVGEETTNTPGVVSEDQVKLALRRVKDPDLNLNIIDIGLVYGIEVKGTKVKVDMTLTSPGCPSGAEIMGNAEQEIKTLPGVESVDMNLVWTPFWTPEKMEPRVRAYLGF